MLSLYTYRDSVGEWQVRMGVFHTICHLISIFDKRFQVAGLRDLCVESGVIDDGSVAARDQRRSQIQSCNKVTQAWVWGINASSVERIFTVIEDNHPEDVTHDEQLTIIDNFQNVVNQVSLEQVLEKSCTKTRELLRTYLWCRTSFQPSGCFIWT